MSKPVFSDLFTFEGRRNRKSYILYTLSLLAISLPVGAFMGAAAFNAAGLGTVVLLLVYIPLMISSLAVGSQRCRDMGWTGWAILIAAIPYLGLLFVLVLIFSPGTQGANRYGDDPLKFYGKIAT
ncbi:MAG: hypothetical protein BM558_02130 [Roseobacter sp. MedPE-SW]|nr:MAG: hypothetical protein BM558_02130 [Roseobacter sp. MedPE-SW]